MHRLQRIIGPAPSEIESFDMLIARITPEHDRVVTALTQFRNTKLAAKAKKSSKTPKVKSLKVKEKADQFEILERKLAEMGITPEQFAAMLLTGE